MNSFPTMLTAVAAGFSLFGAFVLLIKLWHQPRFVMGAVPEGAADALEIQLVRDDHTNPRVGYLQDRLAKARTFTADPDGRVVLPFIIQNQGHGSATSAVITLEINSLALEIHDVQTEATKVNAVAADSVQGSEEVLAAAASERLREVAARLREDGTYVQLIARPFPAAAAELVALDVRVPRSQSFVFTYRIQTESRVFQQRTIQQEIRVEVPSAA